MKKDGSVKLALESRELNKKVHKNKYQMPNIEEIMDTVGQTISERKSGDVYFSNMDLTYAYGQLPLSPETSVQCNFSLVGGKSTGTYCFQTRFYGLTTMPAEFQRVMDTILLEFRHRMLLLMTFWCSPKALRMSISRQLREFCGSWIARICRLSSLNVNSRGENVNGWGTR